MFFTFLVFGAALTLELFGSYISIMGLSKNASYILLGLAITLDFAKIIIATVLYKQWRNLHAFLKYTLIPPLIFLIIFTSSGAYAFLFQEFNKTTSGQEQNITRITALEEEKTKLEARKKDIDGQISRLPPESVVQRKRMIELFATEIERINTRTVELDKELPDLKVKNVTETSQGGTIGTIAKAYNLSPDTITKFLVFPLVVVIDPLAIILLTVANFLVEQRKRDQEAALRKKLELDALMAAAQGQPLEPKQEIPAVHVEKSSVEGIISTQEPPVEASLVVSNEVAQEIIEASKEQITQANNDKVKELIQDSPKPAFNFNPVKWNLPTLVPAAVVIKESVTQPIENISSIEEPVAVEQLPIETPLVQPVEPPAHEPDKAIVEVNVPQIEEKIVEEIEEEIQETAKPIEDIQSVNAQEVAEIQEAVTTVEQIEPVNEIINEETNEEPAKKTSEEIEATVAPVHEEMTDPFVEVLIDSTTVPSSDDINIFEELNNLERTPAPAESFETIDTPQDTMVIEESDEPVAPKRFKKRFPKLNIAPSAELPNVETPVETVQETVEIITQAASDKVETKIEKTETKELDDIFADYEVSDSQIMQVMGSSDKDKGFETTKVLDDDELTRILND